MAFEIESIATARALIKDGIRAEATMIVDIGAKRTSLIIYKNNAVWLTTSLPVSNNLLIEDIARALKTTNEKAKQAKFEIGLDCDKKNFRVCKAMEPKLLELITEINKYLAYWQTSNKAKGLPQSRALKILLCGGGANLGGLAVFLSSHLKTKVEIGNPWINIFGDVPDKVPELPFSESLAYTTAIGLALRGI